MFVTNKRSHALVMTTVLIAIVAAIMLAMPVSDANDESRLSVSAVSGSPGETVDIQFVLTGASVESARIAVTWDQGLEFVGIDSTFDFAESNDYDGGFTAVLLNFDGSSRTGAILTVTLRISEDTASGTIWLNVTADQMFCEGTTITPYVENSTVTVSGSAQTGMMVYATGGDVTSGGTIDVTVRATGMGISALAFTVGFDRSYLTLESVSISAGLPNLMLDTFETNEGVRVVWLNDSDHEFSGDSIVTLTFRAIEVTTTISTVVTIDVDENGAVTAGQSVIIPEEGDATVRIMAPGDESPTPSGSISFTQTSMTVEVGLYHALPLRVTGYTIDDLTVTVSNESVIRIYTVTVGVAGLDDEIIIESISTGTATITVTTADGAMAVCTVTVTEQSGTQCYVYYFFLQNVSGDTSGSNTTEEEMRAGFWVRGEGNNAAEALQYAADEHGWQLSFLDVFDGWLDRFMGLTNDEYDPVTGAYTYWAQYHWDGSSWKYNDYALGYLHTMEYQYIAMIYDAHTDTSDANISVTPDDIPDSVRNPSSEGGGEGGGGTGGTGGTTDRISLNPSSVTLQVGDTLTLEVTVSNENDDRTFSWTTSDDSVAIIENGVITAIGIGMATITVETSDGLTATCEVTVVAAPSAIIEVDVDGSGTAILTDEQIEEIMDTISGEDSPLVQIIVNGTEGGFELIIPWGIGSLNDATIRITSASGNMVLDSQTISTLEGDSLTISITQMDPSETEAELPDGSALYEITLLSDGLEIIDLGGTVTIMLPFVGNGDVTVWFVDGSTLTEVDSSYSDGHVMFVTDHLSMWAIGIPDDTSTTDPTPSDNEERGDNTWLYATMIVIVLVIVVLAIVLWLRTKT